MKQIASGSTSKDLLYLDVSKEEGEKTLSLHTSITLFLLSYCESKLFKVILVTASTPSEDDEFFRHLEGMPKDLEVEVLSKSQLPPIISSCCLPALLDKEGKYCHAGLAVVLRYILQWTCEMDPGRNDVAALLGFKKTCLKACAEVSQWTRLCELSIPAAVEDFLKLPAENQTDIPLAILQLEKKLREPVRVHNDDKIRRQKLQQQKEEKKTSSQIREQNQAETGENLHSEDLELGAALSKLSLGTEMPTSTRRPPCVRKVKTTHLPPLEHVFAEGLYFTLTDVVLLPCLHRFLGSLGLKLGSILQKLPLIKRWYLRVQEVPGVQKAAANCGINFIRLPEQGPDEAYEVTNVSSFQEEKQNDTSFIGGPRPTMNKLKENCIQAVFSSHPSPSWTLDWNGLPTAVNPTEGDMSSHRALRKQQQLNNLLSTVIDLAKPGNTLVDFCSGGGHVGIVLAYKLPACQVILIENKEESLIRAKKRCDALGLNNVGFIQANLDYFKGSFQVGVALHACGVATDMVIEHCMKANAAFVISPCCYGFIQNTVKCSFPRSQQFMDVLSYKEHMILCRFADQTAVQLTADRRLIGKQCMGLVDLDRAWAAEKNGYSVKIITMEPESCSPKNNMLVGIPNNCR
uniref:Glutathione S-transferase C-terminal domain-containing protein n=1 Tax=Erpetoichthys calabaricus TaxID=27687 RepID=A0A8C4SK01_ERPCA